MYFKDNTISGQGDSDDEFQMYDSSKEEHTRQLNFDNENGQVQIITTGLFDYTFYFQFITHDSFSEHFVRFDTQNVQVKRKCDIQSYIIQIDQVQSYVIDGNTPYFEFQNIKSSNEMCQISYYQLINSEGQPFNQGGYEFTVNDDDNNDSIIISLTNADDNLMPHNFPEVYVTLILEDDGKEIFIDESIQFEVKCGLETYSVPQIQSRIEYKFLPTNENPYIEVPYFNSISPEFCKFIDYGIYLDDEAIHPLFNQEYTDDSENQLIRFELEDSQMEDGKEYTYWIKATTQENLTFKSESQSTLMTICDYDSAQMIYGTDIQNTIEYIIDGNVPYLEFEQFSTQSTVCQIQSYSLFADTESEQMHPQFEQQYEIQDEMIRIYLGQEMIGSYTYYLQVIAQGGEVYRSDQKTFVTLCGPESASIIQQQLEDTFIFQIDGTIPKFQIRKFETESTVCLINNYQLCQDSHCDQFQSNFEEFEILEDSKIQFQLKQEQKGTFEFFLKVSADGGEYYISSLKTFSSQCGIDSTEILPSLIDEKIIYEIDGNIPYFQFEEFSTTSSICQILSYQIYENPYETTFHDNFETAKLIEQDENIQISFELQEEILGSFNYYIKVIADGGSIYWSEMKVFETQCGAESAQIIPSDIDSPMIKYIQGSNIPTLNIDKFQTQSLLCPIVNYQLYEQNQIDDQFHSLFESEYQETETEIIFKLKQQMLGSFTYFLKVTASGGEEFQSVEKIFETQCNEYSSTIGLPNMNDTYIYYIDDSTPEFYLNEFYTDSICLIESYQLYLTDDEISDPNKMIAEGIVEGGIVKFQMDVTQQQNITFILVVTAMGGSQYVSEENLFQTQCDIGSATILAQPIDDLITYQIDGQHPYFTIDQFQSGSENCHIEKYELFTNNDDSGQHHPAFEHYGTETENDEVRFTLLEEQVGTFQYYLKVTAQGGSVYWTQTPKTFETLCGPASARIQPSEIPDETQWEIDINTNPQLILEEFSTESTVCNEIVSYELYESIEQEEIHSNFEATYNIEEDQVYFQFKEQEIGNFSYFLKVKAIGGEEYWSQIKYFISYCGINSAQIVINDIGDIEYFLDDNIPVLEVNQFTVQPEICVITSYQLFTSKNENAPHPSFQNEGIGEQIDDSVVQFKLKQATVETFEYYLRVEADGEAYVWTEELNFIVSCGEQSTIIVNLNLKENNQWVVINDQNFFDITDQYGSQNSLCPIESYVIINNDDLNLNYDLGDQMFIQPIQKDIIGQYNFTMKVTAQGGAQREDQYTLNVGCVPILMQFRATDEFIDKIALYSGDPLLNTANIYEIESFEFYSSYSMPSNISCPILQYDIVETSAAIYSFPNELQIAYEYQEQAIDNYPIMLSQCEGQETPCNEITLVATNIIESYKFIINVTIDNEWNGTQSSFTTPEISLTLTCKGNSTQSQLISTIYGQQDLGEQYRYEFSGFGCDEPKCCKNIDYEISLDPSFKNDTTQLISSPLFDSSRNNYYVIINPQIPDSRNYFYIHATNTLDNSTIVSPMITFTKMEPIPRLQITNAQGLEEGIMEPTSLFSEELFETYNLKQCKFSSNLAFNFIYCINGNMIMQYSNNQTKLLYNQLPQQLIDQINQNGEEEEALILIENMSNRQQSYIIAGSTVYLMEQIEEETIQFTLLFDLSVFESQEYDFNPATITDLKLFNTTSGVQWGIIQLEKQSDIMTQQYLLFTYANSSIEPIKTLYLNDQQIEQYQLTVYDDNLPMVTQVNDQVYIFQITEHKTLKQVSVTTVETEQGESEVKLIEQNVNLADIQIKDDESKQMTEFYLDMIYENPEIDSFNVFYQYLAISYDNLGLIVVIDLEKNQIVYIIDDSYRKFNIKKQLLHLGSNLEDKDLLKMRNFKLLYTTQATGNTTYNEVSFMSDDQSEEVKVFENRNLFESDGQSELKVKFTSRGTNIIQVNEEVDPPIMQIFVQAQFDEIYVAQDTVRRLQEIQEDADENILKQEVRTQISEFKPAATTKCQERHGTANVFVNKFQPTQCQSCEEIYHGSLVTEKYYLDNNIDLKDYEYDRFIAFNLCPDLIPTDTEEQVVIVMSMSVVVAVCCFICICCCICKPNMSGLKPRIVQYFSRKRKPRGEGYSYKDKQIELKEDSVGASMTTSNKEISIQGDGFIYDSINPLTAERKQIISIQRYQNLRNKHFLSASGDLLYGEFLSLRARNLIVQAEQWKERQNTVVSNNGSRLIEINNDEINSKSMLDNTIDDQLGDVTKLQINESHQKSKTVYQKQGCDNIFSPNDKKHIHDSECLDLDDIYGDNIQCGFHTSRKPVLPQLEYTIEDSVQEKLKKKSLRKYIDLQKELNRKSNLGEKEINNNNDQPRQKKETIVQKDKAFSFGNSLPEMEIDEIQEDNGQGHQIVTLRGLPAPGECLVTDPRTVQQLVNPSFLQQTTVFLTEENDKQHKQTINQSQTEEVQQDFEIKDEENSTGVGQIIVKNPFVNREISDEAHLSVEDEVSLPESFENRPSSPRFSTPKKV